MNMTLRERVSVLLCIIAPAATALPVQAIVSGQPTTIIALEEPIHFLAPDGSDVLVQPDAYVLEATEEWLRLTPGEWRHDAYLIEANKSTHVLDLETPLALSLPGATLDELDLQFALLLLPGGQSLEAIGSPSRSWGQVFSHEFDQVRSTPEGGKY